MLRDLLPEYCLRRSIFLSYSSENRPLAEKIAQTLKNSGHRVFFDKDSLPAASDYNERIRKAIRHSDCFLFLASRSALEHGKYTLTELDFAKQRWPSPVGRVFPVIVDPDLRPEALPTYLSGIQTTSVTGNAVAEIAATIEQTGNMNTACRACVWVSSLALIGVIGLASGLLPMSAPFKEADFSIVAPEFAHFRPRARPPDDPSAAGADTSWTASPVTLTLPIAYSHRNTRSVPVQVLAEDAEVTIGKQTAKFVWTHVVEIVTSSIADKSCGDDWLCRKGNVKVEKVAPGDTLPTRETMFLQPPPISMSWQDFMDTVLALEGPISAKIVVRTKIAVANGVSGERIRERECNIDVAASRQRMIAAGFVPGNDPRPAFWQPRCLAK